MAASNYDPDLPEEPTALEINFNKAADHVAKLSIKFSNEQLLQLYGLYKQGTVGKCNTSRPGWFDGKGRRKWDAWNSKADLTIEEAKEKYVEFIQNLDPDFTLDTQGNTDSWVSVSSLKKTEPEPALTLEDMTVLEVAREDCGNRLEELLTENPELAKERDEYGLTILHWAADRNSTDALCAGIEGGCDLNAVDNEGQTALHYAVFCGHLRSTRLLLKAGARKDIKDSAGKTPKELAEDKKIRDLFDVDLDDL